MLWIPVYDENSEFWPLAISQIGVNETYTVPLNATYASLNSQTRYIHMTA